MQRTIRLDDTDFRGNTTSYGKQQVTIDTRNCTRCGSSLATRRVKTERSSLGAFVIDFYLCRCGRSRKVKRAA